MFCPQCGQQQTSGDMRFCSRCGFPLGGVATLLSSGGQLPVQTALAAAPVNKNTPRRRGYKQGCLMLITGMLLTPILAVLSESQLLPEAVVALCALLLFWGGILRIIYARIFEDGAASTPAGLMMSPTYMPPVGHTQFAAGAPPNALPIQQGTPVNAWRPPNSTAEIASPPSVTENTTRLLEERQEPPAR